MAEDALRAPQPAGQDGFKKTQERNLYENLPGAPDGECVVIQYDSSFEHKQSAIEAVTPMIDKDGQWKVSGYFIK